MPDVRLSDVLSLLPSGALPFIMYILVVLRALAKDLTLMSTRLTEIAVSVKGAHDELRTLNGRLIRIEEWRLNFEARCNERYEEHERERPG